MAEPRRSTRANRGIPPNKYDSTPLRPSGVMPNRLFKIGGRMADDEDQIEAFEDVNRTVIAVDVHTLSGDDSAAVANVHATNEQSELEDLRARVEALRHESEAHKQANANYKAQLQAISARRSATSGRSSMSDFAGFQEQQQQNIARTPLRDAQMPTHANWAPEAQSLLTDARPSANESGPNPHAAIIPDRANTSHSYATAPISRTDSASVCTDSAS